MADASEKKKSFRASSSEGEDEDRRGRANDRQMKITKKELADAKVPLHLRDYCAHLVVPLLECQRKNYYLPWKCKHERHEWEVCEYTDFLMRQREYKKQAGKQTS